jgi:hypothetical protein
MAQSYVLWAKCDLLGLHYPSNLTTVAECVVSWTAGRVVLLDGSLSMN